LPTLPASVHKTKGFPGSKEGFRVGSLLIVCPELAEAITDATEQQRQRPAKRIQKKYYSGKQKPSGKSS